MEQSEVRHAGGFSGSLQEVRSISYGRGVGCTDDHLSSSRKPWLSSPELKNRIQSKGSIHTPEFSDIPTNIALSHLPFLFVL
jgi:hypothetical protein